MAMAGDMVRMQLEMTQDRLKMLEDLMVRCGLDSRSEVLNAAISVFTWAVTEVEHGNKVGSVDTRTQNLQVLKMAELETAARNVSVDPTGHR